MAQTTDTFWDRCLVLAKQAGELLGYGIVPDAEDNALDIAIERFLSSRAVLPYAVRPDPDEVRSILWKVSHQEYVRVSYEVDRTVAANR